MPSARAAQTALNSKLAVINALNEIGSLAIANPEAYKQADYRPIKETEVEETSAAALPLASSEQDDQAEGKADGKTEGKAGLVNEMKPSQA